jgi:hypothetical protein
MNTYGTISNIVEPCILTIQPELIFKVCEGEPFLPTPFGICSLVFSQTTNPIIMGVHVDGGVLQVGAPLCIPSKKFLDIGRVTAIRRTDQDDPQPIHSINEGAIVIIKVEQREAANANGGRLPVYDRDFDFSAKVFTKLVAIEQLPQRYRTDAEIQKAPFTKAFLKVFGFKGRE